MTEYFLPGTAPTAKCHWHDGGEVHLPGEYAEWEATERSESRVPSSQKAALPGSSAGAEPGARNSERFRITSPENGDHYRIPPGVERRYATVALRASGSGGTAVRWSVDGRAVTGERWTLTPGSHRIRAASSRESAEVTVTVE